MKNDTESGGRHVSDWSQWTVEHMWQVLQGENPERTARHSGAWYDVMDACARHRDRLRAFRDQLAQRWSGAAADAYVAKLDQLIKGLDETTEAAFNTYRALSTMADAVAAARKQMAPLYAQWQRYEQEEHGYRDQWWVMQVIRDNPVTREEREALNRPARAIMNVASDAIFESYLRMTPAPPYEPAQVTDLVTPISAGGEDKDLGLPVVTPLQRQTGLQHPLRPSIGSDVAPVLDGSISPTDPTRFPPPWEDHAGPQASSPGIGTAPSVPIVSRPVVGQPSAGGQRLVTSRDGTSTSGPHGRGQPSGTVPNVAPPVIGARPGAMGWAPAAPVSSTPAGRRVAPVGGVLGHGGSSHRRGRSHDGQWTYQGDEVFAIDTSSASPSVIVPGPEPVFDDPGPTIGSTR